MRWRENILRILCTGADILIIMLLVQVLMIGAFNVSNSQADFLFQILFAMYGVLLSEYWGQTVGKYFGRLCCVDVDGGKKVTMLHMGLREMVKAMYLIPVVGWCVGLVSMAMMFARSDGRTLHDLVGKTRVVTKALADKEKMAKNE